MSELERVKPTPKQTASGVTLIETGLASCGSPPLKAQFQELLGDLTALPNIEVSVEGRDVAPAGFRINFVLSGEVTGSRSLEAGDCAAALQAAAVVLALAINPDVLEHPRTFAEQTREHTPKMDPSPEVASGGPGDGVLPPPATPAIQTPEKPLPYEELRALVQVAGRISGGESPFPSFGAEVTLGLSRAWWALLASGILEPPRSQALQEGASVGFFKWGAELRGCAGPHLGQVWLSGCTGASISKIKGTPQGLVASDAQTALLYSALLGGDLGVAVGRAWELHGGAEAVIPFSNPRFVAFERDGNVVEVHQVRTGMTLRLGARVYF